jgi:hypothetical protein
VIIQLKREVENVLQESEYAAAEARESGAAALSACEVELASQKANVEWLQAALERTEARSRSYEMQLAGAGADAVAERVAAAVAKARAPLELRNEGLAVRGPPSPSHPSLSARRSRGTRLHAAPQPAARARAPPASAPREPRR